MAGLQPLVEPIQAEPHNQHRRAEIERNARSAALLREAAVLLQIAFHPQGASSTFVVAAREGDNRPPAHRSRALVAEMRPVLRLDPAVIVDVVEATNVEMS